MHIILQSFSQTNQEAQEAIMLATTTIKAQALLTLTITEAMQVDITMGVITVPITILPILIPTKIHMVAAITPAIKLNIARAMANKVMIHLVWG